MSELPEPELVLQGGRPVARQIEEQIRDCILQGLLHPGEALPTVRAVAVGLGITPHAVAEAYRNLETDGWLTDEQGGGPFVASLPAPVSPLEHICREALARAERLGYSADEVLHTLQAFLPRR
jgi:GntR family transcriptional regulator